MIKKRDNVIPLLTRGSRDARGAQDASAADEQQAVSDRLRAKAMLGRLDERKIIRKISDRIRMAKNLGHILGDMKSAGHRSEKLLRKLGIGREGDSTKQLRTRVLSEDATEESDGKKIKGLAKHVSVYLAMAQGAARLMGKDPELIVLRLFENTSYQIAEDVTDEKIAAMDQIRQLLVRMADAAVRRHDFAAYLQLLESRTIGWDVDGSFGNYDSVPTSAFIGDRAARHVSCLGYAPTVFLFSQSAGPDEPVEGEAFQIDFAEDPDAVRNFLWHGKPLPRKHRMPVGVDVSRELWFGVAPLEGPWEWRPIFEKRLLLRLSGQDGGERSINLKTYDPTILRVARLHLENVNSRLFWLHQFTLLPRCANGATLSMSVSPHLDTAESIGSDDIHREDLEERWLVELNHFDSEALAKDDDISPGQFFYEAVDLASCTRHLDQVADPNDWEYYDGECGSVTLNDRLWPHYDDKEAWYQDFSLEGRPRMHLLTPNGSLARAIELNLLQDEQDDRLDGVLFDTVAQRLRAARDYHRQVLQDRQRRVEGLLDSWVDS